MNDTVARFWKRDESDVAKIRAIANTGIAQRKIAKAFGVSQIQISRIIRGERWTQ